VCRQPSKKRSKNSDDGLLGLFLNPEDYLLPSSTLRTEAVSFSKSWKTFTRLHGIISHKMVLLTVTAVTASNLTSF
jgi:hypothetical protein